MKNYCAYCNSMSRSLVNSDRGELNEIFFRRKAENSLVCVCNKKATLKELLTGSPIKMLAVVGSMWCISIFSQAQEGLVVQSEKVYLGKNQQPASMLKVVPLEEKEPPQIVPWTGDRPEEAAQEPVVKLTPIPQKKATQKDVVAKVEKPKAEQAETQRVEPSVPKFEILEKDETLSLALRRWAVMAGYQLVWDTTKDFPARHTNYGDVGFESAIEEVMRDTGRSSYPMHACLYKNKVLRVLHVSQSCER